MVDEAIGGVRVVKGFGQEEQEQEQLEAASAHLFASRLRMIRLTARYNPALTAIPSLGLVGVLALGGWLAIHGSITLGTFLAFSAYLAQMTGPVRMLTYMVTLGQEARASVIRVFDIIDSRPVITDKPDAIAAAGGRGRHQLRRRPVRLRARRAGPARPFVPRRAGRDGRRGRRVRLGQVHPGPAAAPVLRPAGRLGPHRRARHRGRDARLAARRDRAGHGGQLPVLRHGAGQHRLRQAGRHRGGDHRRGPGGAGPRVHRQAAPGLRHRGRRAGPDAVRRAAAAGGPGPGADHQPPAAAAGRRDLGHRPAPGGGDPRRAARGHAGAHHADHRAPPVDAEPGRPDRGPRSGPGGRQRHARGAERALPAVPAAHHRRGGRGRGRRPGPAPTVEEAWPARRAGAGAAPRSERAAGTCPGRSRACRRRPSCWPRSRRCRRPGTCRTWTSAGPGPRTGTSRCAGCCSRSPSR